VGSENKDGLAAILRLMMQGRGLFTFVLLSGMVVLPAISLCQAITVRVDGGLVAFPGVGPQKVNGRVLVPLRGVMEKLGAYVGYQPSTKTVTATKSGIDVTLRLGERAAVVNNRTVTLDVPAQEFRGSTMVPLRFVGEALGAEVRWNAETSTVDISTSGTPPAEDPNDYTPPGQGGSTEVRIDSFDVEPQGFLRGGTEIRVRMRGTPGGRASFSIPGVAEDVRLAESAAGVYVGPFVIPADRALNVSQANIVGRLVVNGREKLIQSDEGISIDTQSPELVAITPEPNSRVTRNRPNISVTFDDKSGSGIDPNSVEVKVDNKDVTADAQVTAQFMSYRPDQALAAGRHDVAIIAKDRAGNTAAKSWSFRVAAGNEVIKSFTFEADDEELRPGTDVKFTLVGEPGGHASFSVGDRLQNVPMPEVDPGRYVATYTIRRNDNFENTQVVAKLVTKGGETFTSEATNALNVNSTLEPPLFTDPEENAKVGSKVVLRGRAAPGSVVRIRIEYRKTALGVFDLKGTVADLEVTADSKGNWITDSIDMDTGLGGGSATFTITAVTVGANDKTSEATVLKLRR
jgi:hypothetical protein